MDKAEKNAEKNADALKEFKELKARAKSLSRNCMPDTYGPFPYPFGLKEEPLLITHLLTEVINLAKPDRSRKSDDDTEKDTSAEIPAGDQWPDNIVEQRDKPVLLFGFRMRAKTPEEKLTAIVDGEDPEKEVRTTEPLAPLIVQLPGTPLDLVDMYDAYVHGITDLEEYWEDTWFDDFDGEFEDDEDDTEERTLEEIKEETRALAEQISTELALGEKGTMSVRTLMRTVSNLDDIFDPDIIAEENLHEKIDRLAEQKFIRWLHKIPQGPATHFDKIKKTIQRFPFSNNETGTSLLNTVKRAARITVHRQKIGWKR